MSTTPLAACPTGLFWFGDILCFKPRQPEGGADAWDVTTGQYFWGGATNQAVRAGLLVTPIDTAEAALRLAAWPAEPTFRSIVQSRD